MPFFSQMPGAMGPQMGGMAGGSPSAFTSPGLDPMMLAQLLRMQGGGIGAPGGGALGMPGLPGGGGVGLPPPPQLPGAAGLGQPGGAPGGMPGGGLAGLLGGAGAGAGAAGGLPGGATLQPGPGGGQNLLQIIQQMQALGGGGGMGQPGGGGLATFLRSLGMGGGGAGNMAGWGPS